MRSIWTLFIIFASFMLVACGAGQPGENNHPSKTERAQNANADKSNTLVWDEKNWDSADWK